MTESAETIENNVPLPVQPTIEERVLKILAKHDVYVNTKFTPLVREKFLAVLQETGNVTLAADLVGLSRIRAYQERDKDKEFATAWDEALEIATDYLEYNARCKAIEGVMKPVFYKGVICGYIPEYSDRLHEFLLVGNRPGKYNRNLTDLPPGSEIIIAIKTGDGSQPADPVDVTPNQIEEEQAITD